MLIIPATVLLVGVGINRIQTYRLLLLLSVVGIIASGGLLYGLLPAEEPQAGAEDEIYATAEMSADAGGDEESAGAPAPAANEAPDMGKAAADSAGGELMFVFALLILGLVSVGMLGSIATGIILTEGARTGVLLALAGPLLAAMNRKEADVETRGRILGFVEAHPGIHFSALRDALGLANGVTAHHLYKLEQSGQAISWSAGRRRRYAVSGIDRDKLSLLEKPVHGMQQAILEVLVQSEALGLSATELRLRLEASRQLMSYHLQQLYARKLVAREGKGRKARWTLSETGSQQLKVAHEIAV
jgi:DNA-binding transcriptional ArsR family regulator